MKKLFLLPLLIFSVTAMAQNDISVRMVWGTLVDYRGRTITDVCNYSRYSGSGSQGYAVTGERFPICFAVAEQTSSGFEVNEDGYGYAFAMSTSGFRNEYGDFTNERGLVFYRDSLGNNRLDYGEVSGIHQLGSNGVLVLWVTGDYEQSSATWDYKINVAGRGSDEVTLHSMPPRLAWTTAKGTDAPPAACKLIGSDPTRGKGSKFDAAGCPTRGHEGVHAYQLDYVLVGEAIDLSLRAYNEKSGKTCTTCNFNLKGTAQLTTPAGPATSTGFLNFSPNMKIENGYADLSIRGARRALLPDSFVTALVTNNHNDLYKVSWDSLQFNTLPIPYPERAEIYDDDGDGIGDRIKITYSRGFRRDSLPNMIEVKWDPYTTATVLFGLGKLDNGKYIDVSEKTGAKLNEGGAAENLAFWSETRHHIKPGGLTTTIDARNSSIANTQIESIKDTIILLGKFSWDVLAKNESGKILSWATLKINANSVATSLSLGAKIESKIATTPIIPDYSKTANANTMQLIKNGVSLQVAKNTSLEIFSLKGKLIRKMNFASGVYSVELSDLPKGMYIAKAKFGNSKTETLKIPVM
ncbi:MAG: T9SS type A sorting domain-containing protein [Fibromonadales bacterium]|nr:T9SS type A sorting domain-containing protein [Fibromonadales bacterium]